MRFLRVFFHGNIWMIILGKQNSNDSDFLIKSFHFAKTGIANNVVQHISQQQYNELQQCIQIFKIFFNYDLILYSDFIYT